MIYLITFIVLANTVILSYILYDLRSVKVLRTKAKDCGPEVKPLMEWTKLSSLAKTPPDGIPIGHGLPRNTKIKSRSIKPVPSVGDLRDDLEVNGVKEEK